MKLLFILLSILPNIFCDSDVYHPNQAKGEKQLLEYLLERVPKHNAPLDTRTFLVNLDLEQILDTDEKSGTLTVKMSTIVSYETNASKWDPDEFFGTESVELEPGSVWSPDTTIRESVRLLYKHRRRDVLHSDGAITTHNLMLTAELSCDFDVSFFPFDEQICNITIAVPVGSHNISPTVETLMEEAMLEFYSPNDQWRLVRPVPLTSAMLKTAAGKSNKFMKNWVVIATLQLKRRPLFYLIVVIFPNIMIYLLSTLVFFLPLGSGDKINYIVTIFLAEIVNVGALASFLPASSLGFPLLAYFVLSVTVHLSLLCVATVIVVNTYHFAADREPSKLVDYALSSEFLTRHCLNKRPVQTVTIPTSVVDDKQNAADNQRGQMELTDKVDSVEKWSMKSQKIANLERENCESDIDWEKEKWAQFAEILDSLFFILHVIGIIGALLCYCILFWGD